MVKTRNNPQSVWLILAVKMLTDMIVEQEFEIKEEEPWYDKQDLEHGTVSFQSLSLKYAVEPYYSVISPSNHTNINIKAVI